ncbi:MAG TPA: alanine racemase [Acidocella sp.]|nr:alanine racemase [Acidocella sp.]
MDGLQWQDGAIMAQGYPGYLTIDLQALVRNYRRLAALAAPAATAAVVKADAYGLGAARVAPALAEAGCRHFFVAHAGEALALRPLLPPEAQLMVLNGLLPGSEAACAQAGIIPVLNSLEQLANWQAMAAASGQVLPALLQFDTGMSRLGFAPEERAALQRNLASGPSLDIRYVMSHLACADEPAHSQNAAQLQEMRKVAAQFAPIPLCFANSGGILLGPDYHGALVRPGIALYGGAPAPAADNPMEPVVRLDVAVIQTRRVGAGAAVGYSASYVAPGEARLATLAAGYADGLPRSLSGRGAAYYQGVRLPILGRVSMDSITIDISALPEDALKLGSLVEMIGPHQTLEMLAADAGTISYEILTSLGHRYRRDYR